MALKKDYPTLNKVKNNEEIFVLRAQDASAAKLVILWIAENLHAPESKLKDAFECAMRMRKYEHKKAAD